MSPDKPSVSTAHCPGGSRWSHADSHTCHASHPDAVGTLGALRLCAKGSERRDAHQTRRGRPRENNEACTSDRAGVSPPRPGPVAMLALEYIVAPRKPKPNSRRRPHAGAAWSGGSCAARIGRHGGREIGQRRRPLWVTTSNPKPCPCGTRESEASWRLRPSQAGPQAGGRRPLLGVKEKSRRVMSTRAKTPSRPPHRPPAHWPR